MRPLLKIEELHTRFPTSRGVVRAVDGVTLSVSMGMTLGVVGESGCGKSVTMLSTMGLIPNPLLPQTGGRVVAGHVWFDDRDLLAISENDVRRIRGAEIAMVFQDPMTSLNPTMRIGRQIAEAVALHRGLAWKDAKSEAVGLLEQVEIPSARERLDDYPHQFSGGMRQRAMIAMALAGHPRLLIADEPTTALDVTVQAQILDLLVSIQDQHGMAIVLISHNLGVVAGVSDHIAVMYAGKVVEYAPVDALFAEPRHPYTQGLLEAVPTLESSAKQRLTTIRGVPPDLISPPSGCRFHPRCESRLQRCEIDEPPLFELEGERRVACWLLGGF